jgi:hypothetical protein
MPDMPIIIGGFYRSGTTLLRRLLDAHSRIHCGPEVKFFKDFYGDYLDDPLGHVRLFATARSYGLPQARVLEIFGRAFVAFHVEAARAAGKARWADKNPENALYMTEWEKLLPQGFTFVHVVRNPLDALASLVEIGFPKAVPADFEGKVQLYERFRDAGTTYCLANPSTSTEVDYDALVTEPETTLRTLTAALGEAFEPSMLSDFGSPARGHGIEDPKAAAHATVHAGSVGRGRRELSPDEVELVTRRLGKYRSAKCYPYMPRRLAL